MRDLLSEHIILLRYLGSDQETRDTELNHPSPNCFHLVKSLQNPDLSMATPKTQTLLGCELESLPQDHPRALCLVKPLNELTITQHETVSNSCPFLRYYSGLIP